MSTKIVTIIKFPYAQPIDKDLQMEKQQIQEKINQIASQRQFLVQLLDQPNLGTLRLDVNQALEELDELIEECEMVFGQKN